MGSKVTAAFGKNSMLEKIPQIRSKTDQNRAFGLLKKIKSLIMSGNDIK